MDYFGGQLSNEAVSYQYRIVHLVWNIYPVVTHCGYHRVMWGLRVSPEGQDAELFHPVIPRLRRSRT